MHAYDMENDALKKDIKIPREVGDSLPFPTFSADSFQITIFLLEVDRKGAYVTSFTEGIVPVLGSDWKIGTDRNMDSLKVARTDF